MTDEMPLVVFAHGKETGPWGTKIVALAEAAMQLGAVVASIDYADLASPEDRVQRLLDYDMPRHSKLILVGSSMGGYVATVAATTLKPDGLFLMAPAFYMPGYAQQDLVSGAKHCYIVHGTNDTVIPIANSVKFARQNKAYFKDFQSDHRLNDVLDEVTDLFGRWLLSVLSAV